VDSNALCEGPIALQLAREPCDRNQKVAIGQLDVKAATSSRARLPHVNTRFKIRLRRPADLS
jgi:hypothetical protein